MAEQFTFEQGLRYGGAVDGDEWRVGPVAVLVERSGHELFAGAGFTANEDGDRFGCDAPDFLVEFLHQAAIANNGIVRGEGIAHFQRFGHEPAAGARFRDQLDKLFHLERLEQVIIGPLLGGFDGSISRPVRGHQNDGQARPGRVQSADQFHPVQTGQSEVCNHDVKDVCFGPA